MTEDTLADLFEATVEMLSGRFIRDEPDRPKVMFTAVIQEADGEMMGVVLPQAEKETEMTVDKLRSLGRELRESGVRLAGVVCAVEVWTCTSETSVRTGKRPRENPAGEALVVTDLRPDGTFILRVWDRKVDANRRGYGPVTDKTYAGILGQDMIDRRLSAFLEGFGPQPAPNA